MTLNDRELQVVLAVFYDCMSLGDSKMNTFIGSETIKDMKTLFSKIYHKDYCERNGIEYEQMTEDDFERAAFERLGI